MTLVDLWLPIVFSGIAVFIAAALAHTVLPHHRGDWGKTPAEDDLMETLRSRGIGPGQYFFPFASCQADMKDEQFKKKYQSGPHGTLSIWPGPPDMTRSLIFSLIFYLVVSVFVAYLGLLAIETGEFREAFRVTGTAAIMAYALGSFPHAIWFGRSGRNILTDLIDNVVFGLITGLIFGWLWPAAPIALPAAPTI